MQQTQTTQTTCPSDEIQYSWRRGVFFYRIERNYLPIGQVEVVARIPKWIPDSEWIAINAVRGLKWGLMFNR